MIIDQNIKLNTAHLPIEMYETKAGVVIGSKFNGSQEFRDTNTGTFYATKPTIDGAMEKLQAQILEWVGQEHRRIRREIRESGYTDNPVNHWPTKTHQQRWHTLKAVRDAA